jgi:hypothetical protein
MPKSTTDKPPDILFIGSPAVVAIEIPILSVGKTSSRLLTPYRDISQSLRNIATE